MCKIEASRKRKNSVLHIGIMHCLGFGVDQLGFLSGLYHCFTGFEPKLHRGVDEDNRVTSGAFYKTSHQLGTFVLFSEIYFNLANHINTNLQALRQISC
jgi:hypothetical protein